MTIPIRTRVALFVTLFFAVVIVVLTAVLIELYETYSYREFDVTLQAAASSVANRMVREDGPSDATKMREDIGETLSDFQRKIGLIRVRILDDQGKAILSYNDPDSVTGGVKPKDFLRKGRRKDFITLHFHNLAYRAASAEFELDEGAQGSVIVVGSLASLHDSIDTIRAVALLVGPITILIVGLGSFLLAKRALKPLEKVTEDINRIEAGRLPTRLTTPGTKDEIERLTASFNGLLGRINALMDAQRDFLMHASHELKTPLTVIQTEMEMLLMRPDLNEQDMENLQQLLSEVEYAANLAVDLIFLSRLESANRMEMSQINVDEIVREVLEHLLPIARRRGIAVGSNLQSNSLIFADRGMLRRAFLNIIENSIKYGKKGGQVIVSTKSSPSLKRIAVVVGDDGEGIDEDEIDRVFDRFYRTREARSGVEKGSGLGLAIAKEIVEQHKGKISIKSKRGIGTVVAMEFEMI